MAGGSTGLEPGGIGWQFCSFAPSSHFSGCRTHTPVIPAHGLPQPALGTGPSAGMFPLSGPPSPGTTAVVPLLITMAPLLVTEPLTTVPVLTTVPLETAPLPVPELPTTLPPELALLPVPVAVPLVAPELVTPLPL